MNMPYKLINIASVGEYNLERKRNQIPRMKMQKKKRNKKERSILLPLPLIQVCIHRSKMLWTKIILSSKLPPKLQHPTLMTVTNEWIITKRMK